MDLTPLLLANAELLDSACDVLAGISTQVYTQPAPGAGGHRLGPQIRHVIEFYVCLLDGLPAELVDYDARRRDVRIEKDSAVAIEAMRTITDRLRSDKSLRTDFPLQVRVEDAPGESTDEVLDSSFSRELQAVRSHTVHHFALIAMTLSVWGISVEKSFGVAPSTLRYRARFQDAA